MITSRKKKEGKKEGNKQTNKEKQTNKHIAKFDIEKRPLVLEVS